MLSLMKLKSILMKLKPGNKQFFQSVWVSFSNKVLIFYVVIIGFLGGIVSVTWPLSSHYSIGAVTLGSWIAWPDQGNLKIDPYSLAMINNNGDIPLGTGEGVLFRAWTDSEGRELLNTCQYVIGSSVPSARFWTISFYGTDGKAVSNIQKRQGFTSVEIMRDNKGEFEILASPTAQPGNWIQLENKGKFEIYLRLYDLPASVNISALKASTLPSIVRKGCIL